MRHLPVLQSLRTQRVKALQEAWGLRVPGSHARVRSYLLGLTSEIRALDMAIMYAAMSETNSVILETLLFYADPESYFAIGFFPDPPCGDFMNDFSDTDLGFKPGKQARAAVELLRSNLLKATGKKSA